MKERRIAYFEWLRFFAAAAVVVIHTAADQWSSISYDTDQWRILTFYDSLVRWPVPIFIMITGALFLPRQTPMKDVLTRYIPRMAAAFLFWSGVYTLAAWHSGTPAAELRAKFLNGHYHLWYLPFLAGVYLTIPFLQKIVTDRKLTAQLLGVSFVIGVLVPWLADLGVLLAPDHSGFCRLVENYLNFSFFLDQMFFLVLGHWLHQTELAPKYRRMIYAAGLLGLAVTGAATLWASRIAGNQNSVFFDFTAPNNVCTAAAIFVFAKYHLRSLPKLVELLAGASFGIYLLHPLIIEQLSDRGIHTLAYDPWVSVPVLSAVIFCICALAVWILKKIPLIGRYIV